MSVLSKKIQMDYLLLQNIEMRDICALLLPFLSPPPLSIASSFSFLSLSGIVPSHTLCGETVSHYQRVSSCY